MTMEHDDLLPDERELLAGKTPAAAAPASDDSDADAAAAAEAAAKDEGAEGDKPKEGEGAKDDEIDADALATVADDDAEQRLPTYDVETKDFAAERKTLKDAQHDIEVKWADGKISDEERAAQLVEITDKRDALTRAESKAEALAEINAQNEKAALQDVLTGIAAASKKAGEIDYGDTKAATAYNAMLKAVASDPGNEGKSFPELAQLAHDAMCAVRGVKRAAAPAPPPPKEEVKEEKKPHPREAVPQTLTGMPAAGGNPVGNDFMTSLAASDDPDAAEAALAALPAAQKTALLRSTITAGKR